MLSRSFILIATSTVAACLPGTVCLSQVELPAADLQSLIEEHARAIHELRRRMDSRDMLFLPLETIEESQCACKPDISRLPALVEQSSQAACSTHVGPEFDLLADYDNGFVLRSADPDAHPFELAFNGWIQFRHHGFSGDVDSWTDNAGITRPIRDRNAFDIERARVALSGSALDRRLTYFLQLDGDTDGSHLVDFFDYWSGWELHDRLRLQLGKRKVPASRQWLLGARRTRFIDRPMANDFFRPDRTVGIFAVGRIGETGHYEAMVGNGYRTSTLPPSTTDNRFTFAASNHWDPLGDYGSQIVDYDCAVDPLVRFGHSFVYAPHTADTPGVPLDEANFLRLTDGTQLTQTGALAAGVTVSEFDVYFYGVDAALKWRGWSCNAEAFFRWIERLQADGALPVSELFQRGFYVEGGYFLVAKRLDVNVRYSHVSGSFGNASEFAAGFNWYLPDTHRMKISFDLTSLDGSPLQNTSSDILAGDDGELFRTQFQAEF